MTLVGSGGQIPGVPEDADSPLTPPPHHTFTTFTSSFLPLHVRGYGHGERIGQRHLSSLVKLAGQPKPPPAAIFPSDLPSHPSRASSQTFFFFFN